MPFILTCSWTSPAPEGGYLDLFVMIKDGRIEWKTFTKTPPLYLHKTSCHDPKVHQAIAKGLGHRLRLTNSTNETFKKNVELYSRSMAASGYDYQKVKTELMKFEKIDPVELAKKPKDKSKSKSKGCKAYFISTFEPRVPHPRKIISKNYEILARSEKASKLFPRQNLIAGSRQLKNIGELLSPTVQEEQRGEGSTSASGMDGQSPGCSRGREGPRGRGRGGRRGIGRRRLGEPQLPTQGMDSEEVSGRQENGSYHCPYFKKSGKCDLCKHMLESKKVLSSHFNVNHAIAGHNVHIPATQDIKPRWFIYMEECVHPEGIFQYIGSTTSMTDRWANTKSKINSNKKPGTGLETHFKEGCSQNLGPDLASVRVTLLEHMDTNHEQLF